MTYLARILDSEGVLWWEGAIPDKRLDLRISALKPEYLNKLTVTATADLMPIRTIDARLERELPPEDGGPLLIYRIGAKDVLGD